MIAKTHFTLGHSPDPDDAFMFYALAADKLDTGGWTFEHVMQDIETLNQRALRRELDITAISIHTYPYVQDDYALLSCGASMGYRYGPMVVAREPLPVERLNGLNIAVPGTKTTAFLALSLCIGSFEYEVMPFDHILDAVAQGRVDAGLIIHEGQLTYAMQGLVKVIDLGEWWHSETGLPLPLGANAVLRSLGDATIRRLAALLRQSIEYGMQHRRAAVAHSMQYARDLDTALTDRFVGMYVNDYTLDFGADGRQAVEELLRRGYERGLIAVPPRVSFVAPE